MAGEGVDGIDLYADVDDFGPVNIGVFVSFSVIKYVAKRLNASFDELDFESSKWQIWIHLKHLDRLFKEPRL